MRTELFVPSVTVWDAHTYNALFTMHGLTMLFLFGTPVVAGLGNYILPLLIGADDMAFPRINAIAFWLLVPSLVLLRAGLLTDMLGHALVGGGLADLGDQLLALAPPATGWTFYTPLSASLELPTVSVVLLGLHLSGLAAVMAAINFIATIFVEPPIPSRNRASTAATTSTTDSTTVPATPPPMVRRTDSIPETHLLRPHPAGATPPAKTRCPASPATRPVSHPATRRPRRSTTPAASPPRQRPAPAPAE
jgi:hypothetical protein